MAKYRSYSVEFKRQVAQEFLGGETLHGLGALRSRAEKRVYVRDHRPRGLSVAQGCRLMGIVRSVVYD